MGAINGMHYNEQGLLVGVCQEHRYQESATDRMFRKMKEEQHEKLKKDIKIMTQEEITVTKDPYASLAAILEDAMEQASGGKGKERHAKDDEPFEKQKICEIRHRVGGGYTLGQAIKKCIESQRLPKDRAIAELLGAINYIAAEVICLKGEKD